MPLAARPVKKDGRLKLDKLRAAQLESLDGLPIQVPEQLRQLRERLQGFRALAPIATPAGLRAKLRPYQLEGLAWLQFLRESGLHGGGLGACVQEDLRVTRDDGDGVAELAADVFFHLMARQCPLRLFDLRLAGQGDGYPPVIAVCQSTTLTHPSQAAGSTGFVR